MNKFLRILHYATAVADKAVLLGFPPARPLDTHTTSYSNLIETMRLSRTVFEILSLIFQKLKRSRDSDRAPFRDNLSSKGWDLL